jgi:hypothetical protein
MGDWTPRKRSYSQVSTPNVNHGSSIREDSDLTPNVPYTADDRYDYNKWESRGSKIPNNDAEPTYRQRLRAVRAAKAADLVLRYRGASQGRLFGRNAAVAAERAEKAANEPQFESPSVKRIARF